MLKRILVPVDFSEGSNAAVGFAVDLAKLSSAEMLLVFVIEPMYFATPADLYGPSANLSMLVEEQKRFGEEQLDELATLIEDEGLKVRPIIRTGSPHAEIGAAAKSEKADLIVMATHGRTGLSHFVMGSVAEKVVRTAPCPVLTLREYKAAKKRITGKKATGKKKPAKKATK